MEDVTYEWCVMIPEWPNNPHRGPMSEQDAKEWVREMIEDYGCSPGSFYVARRMIGPRRMVGPWERAG